MEIKNKIKLLSFLVISCSLSGCGHHKEYDPDDNIFTPKPYKIVPTDKYKKDKSALSDVNSSLINLVNYGSPKVLKKVK